MKTRDPEVTRQRILDAAVIEFADYGIAGARVDRIAAAAGSNKQLIYHYFGSKEGLFRAVLDQELKQASEGVALDPDDLEAYAGLYFDFAMAHPRLMRLIAWRGLEASGPEGEGSLASHKVELIAQAQDQGTVSSSFSPEFILSTISTLCTAWVPSNWYGVQLDPSGTGAAKHRDEIVRLVGMMIAANSQKH